jgi:hypothetical protein
MSKLSCIVALVLLAASSSFGAIAVFIPEVREVPPEPATFGITVELETLSDFNLADIVIGINAPANLSFEYSDDWNAAFSNVSPVTLNVGFYTRDIFVGGNNSTALGVTSLDLGTLSVDTSALPPGTYDVTIDNSYDGTSVLGLNVDVEALRGLGHIRKIPEPTSVLIFIGMGLFVRGQRKRS